MFENHGRRFRIAIEAIRDKGGAVKEIVLDELKSIRRQLSVFQLQPGAFQIIGDLVL
jgi:hypothetical protein